MRRKMRQGCRGIMPDIFVKLCEFAAHRCRTRPRTMCISSRLFERRWIDRKKRVSLGGGQCFENITTRFWRPGRKPGTKAIGGLTGAHKGRDESTGPRIGTTLCRSVSFVPVLAGIRDQGVPIGDKSHVLPCCRRSNLRTRAPALCSWYAIRGEDRPRRFMSMLVTRVSSHKITSTEART